MAIGHTRRLHARFTSEAPGTNLHQEKLRHATRLEAASIKTWPNNMGLRALTTSDHNSKIINVRVVRHSDDEEVEPEEATTQQEPSGGTANQSTNETDTSNEGIQSEELDLPKFDSGSTHVNQDKKTNKKGNNGTIPKVPRKPVPAPKSAPNSNHSTPKTTRKGTLIQNDILHKFVDEAIDLSQRVDQTITAWKTSNNNGVNLGKKTSANLELLRENLQDKLNDVNEKWQEMEVNNEGNKITRNALSRAVRSVVRSTVSAFRQIEDFQSEWQANINREKKKSKDDPYKQPKQIANHSMPIPAMPTRKVSYQAVKTNIRPIPEPSRVTPPKNQNIHNSPSPTTKKDGRMKKRMPTTVLILPRPSSGRSQLKCNARFDTNRVKVF